MIRIDEEPTRLEVASNRLCKQSGSQFPLRHFHNNKFTSGDVIIIITAIQRQLLLLSH